MEKISPMIPERHVNHLTHTSASHSAAYLVYVLLFVGHESILDEKIEEGKATLPKFGLVHHGRHMTRNRGSSHRFIYIMWQVLS